MRAEEFFTETVFDILDQFQIEEIGSRKHYVLENTDAGKEIKSFIFNSGAIRDLTEKDIGSKFFPVGISVLPEAKFISLAFFSDDAEFTQLRENSSYVFVYENKSQLFPATPDNKLIFRLIFSNKVDFEKFELLLKMKFSEWNIKSKIL